MFLEFPRFVLFAFSFFSTLFSGFVFFLHYDNLSLKTTKNLVTLNSSKTGGKTEKNRARSVTNHIADFDLLILYNRNYVGKRNLFKAFIRNSRKHNKFMHVITLKLFHRGCCCFSLICIQTSSRVNTECAINHIASDF